MGGNSKADSLLNQSALKICILDDIAPSESEVHKCYRSTYKHTHDLPRQMVCGVNLGKGSVNVAWTGDDWQRGANPPQHLRHPRRL